MYSTLVTFVKSWRPHQKENLAIVKGSVNHIGTTHLLRKNKPIDIPPTSMMTSPNNVNFTAVTELIRQPDFNFLNSYEGYNAYHKSAISVFHVNLLSQQPHPALHSPREHILEVLAKLVHPPSMPHAGTIVDVLPQGSKLLAHPLHWERIDNFVIHKTRELLHSHAGSRILLDCHLQGT